MFANFNKFCHSFLRYKRKRKKGKDRKQHNMKCYLLFLLSLQVILMSTIVNAGCGTFTGSSGAFYNLSSLSEYVTIFIYD